MKDMLRDILQKLREAAYTNDCFWKDHKIDECIEVLEEILKED